MREKIRFPYSAILCATIFLIIPFFSVHAKEISSSIKPPSSTIYFTFDADMTPRMERQLAQKKVKQWYDPEIIDYLETEKIPATIFVTGMFAETYPTTVSLWSQNNLFSIGNHSYSHPGFTPHCYGLATASSTIAKKEEITRTQSILQKITGSPPRQFRFPGLCHTTTDDQLVTQLGLQVVGADDISGDAFNHNLNTIVKTVLKRAHNGSILLMHTGGPHAPKTLAALKKIVPLLRHQGYEFKNLPPRI